MKSKVMKFIWWALIPVLLYALYVVVVIAYGSLNEYKPEELISIDTQQNKTIIASDSSTFSFLIWNIGYAGLGNGSDFFLDGGKMVRPSKEISAAYLQGITNTIAEFKDLDFLLLQEVDVKAKRSYQINEFENIAGVLPNHSKAHALNFNVKFVPKPLMSFSPIGAVQSGLASYSKYQVNEATRYQFPGSFGWPTSVFHLDRCMLVSRIPLESGKELLVINSHNSAYDGGKIKPFEMAYLKEFLLEEYAKGNYIVLGADWNQCPPNFPYDTFSKGNSDDYYQDNIAEDFLPEGWKWVYDPAVPTNRKLAAAYDADKTFTTLIDFYLVSPNIKVTEIKGIDLQFEHSDHQPVLLKIQLQ